MWETRPSIFLYAGTYIVLVILIYMAIKLAYALNSNPIALLLYSQWNRPWAAWSINDWPLLAVAGCFIVVIISLLHGLSKLGRCLFTRYMVVNEQLVVRKFIGLGVVEYRIEMYRIVDFMQVQMASGGLFGFATINLRSTDANNPSIALVGVRQGSRIIEILRNETERCRQKKGIQEFVSPQMLNNQPPGRSR